ncbi:hypothetical protein JKI95_07120 [Corynebacterium aquatimens]|uniref:hypothetical protein n=1 Tax=Corynebacterium aquatimens TaxID=1190508 RepID=UPI002541AD79|nr:hypothetical protein [Corynebacterium aquatimens]QYH19052.1 hypothetical protein JKI95_07120 [Corynebacterium aquatimens]
MDNKSALSPVEQALAELNGNLANARAESRADVTVPKDTAIWIRNILEDIAEGRLVRSRSRRMR